MKLFPFVMALDESLCLISFFLHANAEHDSVIFAVHNAGDAIWTDWMRNEPFHLARSSGYNCAICWDEDCECFYVSGQIYSLTFMQVVAPWFCRPHKQIKSRCTIEALPELEAIVREFDAKVHERLKYGFSDDGKTEMVYAERFDAAT